MRRQTVEIQPIGGKKKKGNKPSVNAGIGGVSASQGVADGTGVSAGISSSGNANLGVGTQISDEISLNAGASTSDGGNVGVGANFRPNDELSLNAGVGTGGVGLGVQAGSSDAAAAGGTAGAIAGAAVGGPVGSAIGSAAGSIAGQGANDIYKGEGSGYGTALTIANPYMAAGAFVAGKVGDAFGGNSRVSKEGDARRGLVGKYTENNIFGTEGKLELPDGSMADFTLDGDNGRHEWYDSKRRVDKEGDRNLFAFETDYTNDADYLSGMLGINFSRLTAGGSAKEIDQVGQLVGNQMLGKVGFGAELSKDNFAKIVNNHRAMYAKAGIESKEEYLGLANQMFGEGRLDDTQYAGMLQGADMLYDADFNKAATLMAGRWEGVQTASATPSRPGQMYAPQQGSQKSSSPYVRNTMVTPEEAMNSVQPFFDLYKERYGSFINKKPNSSSTSNIIQGLLAGVGGIAGAMRLDKLTGGMISGGIKDVYGIIKDQITGGEQPESLDIPDAEFDVGDVGQVDDGNIDWGIADWTEPSGESYDAPSTESDYELESGDDMFGDIFSNDSGSDYSLF